MPLILTPPRRRHLRLVPPCGPLAVTPHALVDLAPEQTLVGVLLGRPYVRVVTAAGEAPQIPPLRAAMNLHLLDEDRVVVVDGDERWFRDVMALHRAGGVERWLVAVRRAGPSVTGFRARRHRETSAAERDHLAPLQQHDLPALFGVDAEHRRPRLQLVPPTPGR
jgi:hypothetical protein